MTTHRVPHPFPWHEGDLEAQVERARLRARKRRMLEEDVKRFRTALVKISKLPRGHGNAAIQIATIAILPRNLR